MARSRRNSLVQSIASNPSVSKETYAINDVLDDTYLFNKLQKLSLALGNTSVTNNANNNNGPSGPLQEPSESVVSSDSVISTTTTATAIENDKYNGYQEYLKRLDETLQNYQQTLVEARLIDNKFDEIIGEFDQISLDTAKFIDDTSNLYDSHKELNALSETIPQYLNYFDSLDLVMRKLNHSTSANVVKRDSFKKLLNSIDQSLIFLQSHNDLLDSETYRIKFKQCLIRAATLIAHYVNNNLRLTYNEIAGKETLLKNPSTREALIYNKFSSTSDMVNEPIQELLKRCYDNNLIKYRDELESILKDCYNTYFDVRNKLLFSIIWSQLDDLIMKQKDDNLVSFIRSMKSYFQDLCQNEYKLFVKFFSISSSKETGIKDVINVWFIKLCEPLYNTTTNKILREQDVNQLCDSIVLFQPFYEFEEGSEEYVRQFSEIYYNKIFDPIVIKLQNQLARRCKNIITNNLIDYKPTINDLMISNHDNSKKTMTESETAMMNSYLDTLSQRLLVDNTKFESKDLILITYYTPLLRSLSLLFKIYDILIDFTLFDELSHYVIHSGIQSLRRAYEVYQGASNTLDTKLIYLGNLLLLRDEIQNLNISSNFDESNSQLNFSPMGTLIKSIKWSNATLFSFAKGLVPRRSESNINLNNSRRPGSITSLHSETSQQNNVSGRESDSRIELIQELRRIIKVITESVGSGIIDKTLSTDNIGSNEENSSKEMQEQNLIEINELFKENMITILKTVHTKIMELIHNETICKFLLEAIKDYILIEYNQFYNKITGMVDSKQINGEILNDIMTPEVVSGLFYNNLTLLMGADDI